MKIETETYCEHWNPSRSFAKDYPTRPDCMYPNGNKFLIAKLQKELLEMLAKKILISEISKKLKVNRKFILETIKQYRGNNERNENGSSF